MYRVQKTIKRGLIIVCGLFLSGCGLKGPLYLPDEPPQENTFIEKHQI